MSEVRSIFIKRTKLIGTRCQVFSFIGNAGNAYTIRYQLWLLRGCVGAIPPQDVHGARVRKAPVPARLKKTRGIGKTGARSCMYIFIFSTSFRPSLDFCYHFSVGGGSGKRGVGQLKHGAKKIVSPSENSSVRHWQAFSLLFSCWCYKGEV